MSIRRTFPALSSPRVARSVACAAIALASASAALFGQCSYEITVELAGPPCLPGHPSITVATGLSDNGIVVGRYEICGTIYTEAFMWVPSDDGKGGVFTTLPRPGNVISASAVGVNSHGIVIGSHSVSGVGPMGFVYDPATGEFKYLEPLHDGVSWTPATTATAINDDNIVTGSRIISEPGVSPPISNAVIWLPYGENGDGREIIVDLGVGDGPSSFAEDGNSGSDAVGYSGSSVISANAKALLWSDGQVIPLGLLPGTIQSTAKATNDLLEVLGACRTPEGPFISFLWVKGAMSQFAPPDGYSTAAPVDISNFGQITGGLLPQGASSHKGYVWQHGEFHLLQSLIVNPPPEVDLTTGRQINAAGQILTRKQLVTPIDVPTGDLNFDCTVDIHDLLYLLKEWGKPGSNADLNGNGTVGVPDLLILLANWGN